MKLKELAQKLAYVKTHYPEKYLEIVEKSGILEPLINNSYSWTEEELMLAYSFLFPVAYIGKAEFEYLRDYFEDYPLTREQVLPLIRKSCPYFLALWIRKYSLELIEQVAQYPKEEFTCINTDALGLSKLASDFYPYCPQDSDKVLSEIRSTFYLYRLMATNPPKYLAILQKTVEKEAGIFGEHLFYCFESRYKEFGKFTKQDVIDGKIKKVF